MFGCYKRVPPNPPKLTIIPSDSVINISVITPVVFKIHGFSDEDLRSMKISTTPEIFSFDTAFAKFTHEIIFSKKVILPQEVPDLPADSLISITFSLTDNYNTTTIVKDLRVIDAFPRLTYDTVTLVFPGGKFLYDVVTKQAKDTTAEPGTFDFGFAISDDAGYVIASADAPWLATTCNAYGISYTINGQRHTHIKNTNVDYNSIDKKFLYYADIVDEYINTNPSNGSGVDHLGIGSIFLFQLDDGRKGAGKILGLTSNSVTLAVKVQIKAANEQDK
jgi:hypothetical protein